MDDDQEIMAAMQKVDEALGTGGGGGGGPQAAAAPSPQAIPNPCEAYNKIRDVLPTLISLAKKIPVVGKRIAAALQLLQTIGDQFCPQS